MKTYIVKSGSVIVRKIAASDSGIINVLPKGSKVYILEEEAGWLKTTSGYYLFKTDNLVPEVLSNENPQIGMRIKAAANLKADSPMPQGQIPTSNSAYIPYGGGAVYASTKEDEQAKTETKKSEQDTATTSDVKKNKYNTNQELLKKYEDSYIQPTQIIQWGNNGEFERDENGDYKLIDAGDLGNANKAKDCVIVDVITDNGKDYFIFENRETGAQYGCLVDNTVRIGKTDSSGNTTFTSATPTIEDEEYNESILDQITSLGSKVLNAYTITTKLTIEDSRTIFGMPYQFMPIVDPRKSQKGKEISAFTSFGRKFQERIVARAPILYMQAGLPIFMRGYSDEVKGKMLESLMSQIENSGGETGQSELQKLIDNSNAQYYSFDEQSTQYFKAVNSACTALAHLLQIQFVQIPTLYSSNSSTDKESMGEIISDFLDPKALGNVNWSLRTPHSLGFYRGAVAFYINSESQIQESFTNTPRQSELAGKMNQISDQAMEAAFLAGGLAGGLDKDGFSGLASLANMQNSYNKDFGLNGRENDTFLGSSLMGSIVNNVTNLIAGGKIAFPEIWGDSQFQRSYNVTIKLDSPETDSVSIFLNILVPLAHILGFVLPRAAGPNMYTSPFLVRCFYKSMFHIDMGMVTSCTITKGDTGAWNIDGLPCQVTVELSIKDLYNVMSQASGVKNNTLISNPAQLEYLANLAGVNVSAASFTRNLELWWALKGVNRSKQGLVGTASDMMQSVFKGIQNFNNLTRLKM